MLTKIRAKAADQKGFTLIELMIVVAILGILAAVAIPQYMGYIASSKERATKSNYETAITLVRGEIAKLDAGAQPSASIAADLNAGGRLNPYDSTQPAFVGGAASAQDGEVGVNPDTAQGLVVGGTIDVTAMYIDTATGATTGLLTTTLTRE